MTVPACGPDDGKASRGCRKVIEGSETCRGVEGDIGRFIGWFITLILGKWMQGFDNPHSPCFLLALFTPACNETSTLKNRMRSLLSSGLRGVESDCRGGVIRPSAGRTYPGSSSRHAKR